MSRSVSQNALTAMFSQDTEEAFLCKLKLSHEDWATIDTTDGKVVDGGLGIYYFINDLVNHTDQYGVEWIGYPFQITLPGESDDELPTASLSIDNVDRRIVEEIRSISSPIAVSLWVVLSSDIDDVIAGPYEFNLNAVSWDAMSVSGNLEYEPILNMSYPRYTFNSLNTPGLYVD